MKGGEKNEEMLIISSSGRDSGHHDNILDDHDLDDRLVSRFFDWILKWLRSYGHPCSLVLAECRGCHPPLPVSPSRCKQEEATGRMSVGVNARRKQLAEN